MKYRKRPVVIDAVQWLGNNYDEVCQLCTGRQVEADGDGLVIHTLEGDMNANLNDWIIRGVKGEAYPCKPDIFDTTYESALLAESVEGEQEYRCTDKLCGFIGKQGPHSHGHYGGCTCYHDMIPARRAPETRG